MTVSIQDVLHFWFAKGAALNWFEVDKAFDADVKNRFRSTLHAAANSKLEHWTETIEGRLALIIVLDQFSRNIHRGNAAAYGNDNACLLLAKHALRMGDDLWLKTYRPHDWRIFLYVPFMHSEDIEDQRRSLELFQTHGPEPGVAHARHHLEIVTRFGRFPHRNSILGRDSTSEELAFLAMKEIAG
ncbi:DUF924 family protein [Roseibium alexandrii]|uniref:DUF924 domain-containing protein n=1 Tax=Roseibium alexandrii (strain DSM 17067 / NCIMB 14079 / DFL-11) TaxID=244592 RepID=A0A5E8GUS9_ROSAD|nr:DUF924 family protein [Roseibium alexandrii]EEE43652.2 Uncharacterized protein SADFL11_938 [Roseibium alexandrii DFL-11]